MAKSKKKPQMTRGQRRTMRRQQIIMGIFGTLIILSMVLALIAR